MFQQNKAPGYMQELDPWIQEHVIEPLYDAAHDYYTSPDLQDEDKLEAPVADIKRAIREKVLESYHNGQGAGPTKGRRNDRR